uniref:Uncharacterized protein n=1 Tax=Romanomermis culicivorax TaxID=13658 RepID=A0A915KG89_ROMCU
MVSGTPPVMSTKASVRVPPANDSLERGANKVEPALTKTLVALRKINTKYGKLEAALMDIAEYSKMNRNLTRNNPDFLKAPERTFLPTKPQNRNYAPNKKGRRKEKKKFIECEENRRTSFVKLSNSAKKETVAKRTRENNDYYTNDRREAPENLNILPFKSP